MAVSGLPGNSRLNLLVSTFSGLLLMVTAVESFLGEDYAWMFFALIALAAILPAFARKSWERLHWLPVLLVSLPFLVKAFDIGFLQSHTTSYLAAGVVALLFFLELEEFTSLESTPGFNVVFVTVSTVAFAGFWALIRWFSDIYLGSSMLVEEKLLMMEFVYATLTGFVLGGLLNRLTRGRWWK